MLDFMKKHAKLLLTITIPIVGLFAFSIIQNFNVFKNDGNVTVIIGGTNVINHTLPTTSDDKKVASVDSVDTPIQIKNESHIAEKPVVEIKKENTVKDNNSLDNAISIESNKKYSVKLLKKGSEKFYKFKLEGISVINFSFGMFGESSYKLIITNSDNNTTVMESEISRKNKNSNNLYLGAGNYFIKVTSGNYWEYRDNGNSFNFAVKISAVETKLTEAESNNTEQKANVIPVNKVINASSVNSDVDYFTFTLDRSASIFPEISFTPVNNYTMKLYDLTITDTLGGEIKNFIFRGDNKLSGKKRQLKLEAGTYIICVSRVEDTSKLALGLHEYNLCIFASE